MQLLRFGAEGGHGEEALDATAPTLATFLDTFRLSKLRPLLEQLGAREVQLKFNITIVRSDASSPPRLDAYPEGTPPSRHHHQPQPTTKPTATTIPHSLKVADVVGMDEQTLVRAASASRGEAKVKLSQTDLHNWRLGVAAMAVKLEDGGGGGGGGFGGAGTPSRISVRHMAKGHHP